MKIYPPTLKHLLIQLAKLQIYTWNLTTTFWHCKKKSHYFWTGVYIIIILTSIHSNTFLLISLFKNLTSTASDTSVLALSLSTAFQKWLHETWCLFCVLEGPICCLYICGSEIPVYFQIYKHHTKFQCNVTWRSMWKERLNDTLRWRHMGTMAFQITTDSTVS